MGLELKDFLLEILTSERIGKTDPTVKVNTIGQMGTTTKGIFRTASVMGKDFSKRIKQKVSTRESFRTINTVDLDN